MLLGHVYVLQQYIYQSGAIDTGWQKSKTLHQASEENTKIHFEVDDVIFNQPQNIHFKRLVPNISEWSIRNTGRVAI